jgi:NADH:ubiquinone oxidoreductase subunit 5 (subunit L)/multisubunit Na+/H+ antiporter MnhA subunit
LGQALHVPALAVLGYAGAVFHCFNHAIFKSLLFFGAGSLIRATGTRDLDILGGLIKRLPVLAAVFTVGAAAISGLPPFMGFASEFLLYLGLFHGGVLARTTDTFAPCVFGLVSLAMIGAASIACYTRLIGFVFLGEPRSDHALHVSGHRPGWRMLWPMMILASLCLLLGVFSPVILRAVEPLVAELSSGATAAFSLSAVPLVWVSIVGLVVLCVVGGLLLFRRKLLSGREVPCDRLTWDCGYHGPTARMQYTASSFGRPIGVFFRVLNPDIFERRLFIPLFAGAARLLLKMRRFQQGRLQLYLLYIFITLVVLLIWQAGGV